MKPALKLLNSSQSFVSKSRCLPGQLSDATLNLKCNKTATAHADPNERMHT